MNIVVVGFCYLVCWCKLLDIHHSLSIVYLRLFKVNSATVVDGVASYSLCFSQAACGGNLLPDISCEGYFTGRNKDTMLAQCRNIAFLNYCRKSCLMRFSAGNAGFFKIWGAIYIANWNFEAFTNFRRVYVYFYLILDLAQVEVTNEAEIRWCIEAKRTGMCDMSQILCSHFRLIIVHGCEGICSWNRGICTSVIT